MKGKETPHEILRLPKFTGVIAFLRAIKTTRLITIKKYNKASNLEELSLQYYSNQDSHESKTIRCKLKYRELCSRHAKMNITKNYYR